MSQDSSRYLLEHSISLKDSGVRMINFIVKEMIQMNLQSRKRLTDLENELRVTSGTYEGKG